MADGHNDALMLLWLVLGWFLMTRQQYQWAMVVLALAPLSKPIGLLALPMVILAILLKILPAWKEFAQAPRRTEA